MANTAGGVGRTGPLRWIMERLAGTADIRLNGERPWDIEIHDERVLRRTALQGALGFGDSYVDGWWSCGDLEELAFRIARAGIGDKIARAPSAVAHRLGSLVSNQQSKRRAVRVARQHYNLGNDLFMAFLGKYKVYSCGYFHGTDDLDVAQRQKLDLICRKLDLRRGERLLDVGGGWGELARHAAAEYGARVTSINISDEQIAYAGDYCRGLDVEVIRCDYRDVAGRFDKIAAIAMFTHVGYRNYRTFMESMHRALEPGGIFLMEGIWGNVSVTHTNPWIDKHVFPGGMMPSPKQTFAALEGLFVAEDLHNFAPDYVATLRSWKANFLAAWPVLRERYDERLRRVFEFYFDFSAGYFRARTLQNWQLALTVEGRPQPACRLS